ncbi:hypothetical protein D1007_30712 [Hordeum vulgare]|nr:hypothetical protein D1007_30712 [Hordeum vulgare]
MGRLVNVHYMDKEAFLTNNADADEEAIVFDTSPSYDDLVANVRHVLEWMDPNDGVKLIGRYDVEVGVKSRLKTLPITSNLHWDVYKEQVEKIDDKSIELFVTKVEPPRDEIDLNRLVSSPMTERTSVPSIEQRIMIDASNAYSQPESEVEFHAPNAIRPPPTSQANEVDVIASEEVILKDGDVDGDFNEVEEGFHGIDIGDLDAYMAQKEMDRELPFRRLYGYDSDDEGPQEELDEDGFTKEENQIHFELTGLEKRTHLFRDLSLAHKAVVDGGMRKMVIEPTPCPDPGEPREENEDGNAYLKKGLKFPSLPDMKVWLSDYAIRNHMPFYVEHSDINLWFTVKATQYTYMQEKENVEGGVVVLVQEAQVLEVVVVVVVVVQEAQVLEVVVVIQEAQVVEVVVVVVEEAQVFEVVVVVIQEAQVVEVVVVVVEEAQVFEVVVVVIQEAQVVEVVVVVVVEEAQVFEVVVVVTEEAQVFEVVVVIVEEAQVLEVVFVVEDMLIMDQHSVIWMRPFIYVEVSAEAATKREREFIEEKMTYWVAVVDALNAACRVFSNCCFCKDIAKRIIDKKESGIKKLKKREKDC